jgi:hypothetical protein
MELQNDMRVEVPIGKHRFRFRRLTWEDDLKLVIPPKTDSRRALLACALVDVDGRVVTLEEATKAIALLRTPVLERAFTIYSGSLPKRRRFSVEALWEAPEPKAVRERIQDEEDDREKETENYMRQTFGDDDVAENEAVEEAIVASSGYKGAVALNPDGTRINPFKQAPRE